MKTQGNINITITLQYKQITRRQYRQKTIPLEDKIGASFYATASIKIQGTEKYDSWNNIPCCKKSKSEGRRTWESSLAS